MCSTPSIVQTMRDAFFSCDVLGTYADFTCASMAEVGNFAQAFFADLHLIINWLPLALIAERSAPSSFKCHSCFRAARVLLQSGARLLPPLPTASPRDHGGARCAAPPAGGGSTVRTEQEG